MMAFDPERIPLRVRRLACRMATLAGVGLLVAGGLEAGASLKLVRNGERVAGQVVDLGTGPNRPFVRFNRPDGQTTVFRAKGLLWSHPGERVPVLLDPARPAAPPVAATPVSLWLLPVLMAVVGGVLFSFGFQRTDRRRR
jgi:hypothetical protein